MGHLLKFSFIEKFFLSLLFLCAIVTILIYVIRFYHWGLTDNPNEFGFFGEYIGGIIGTIVGLIGIIFLYRTYQIQIIISEGQDSRLYEQQFESTFFALLAQQRNILHNIKGEFLPSFFGKPSDKVEGPLFFSHLRSSLFLRLQELNYERNLFDVGNKNKLKIKIDGIYHELFMCYAVQLGHYFRHLYQILKYIDDSKIANKQNYIDLVQAQMCSDELYVCAINGISHYGRKRLLPLLKKYSFLENLTDDDPIFSILVKTFYAVNKLNHLADMNKNIIFVGGVHGVGKSFFTNLIKKDLPSLVSLSCSEIMKWEDPKEKSVVDVVSNQERLLYNLERIIDVDVPYLLDGHFCLINADGKIERVPLHFFRSINPVFIILLCEETEVIIQRLKKRDNKEYDEQIINSLIEDERKCASDVADSLGIPIYEIKSTEYGQIKDVIAAFASEF